MRFECELQGDFDEILANIERSIMVEAGKGYESYVENNRTVSRDYNSGAGFVLTQSLDSVNIVITGRDDSAFESGIQFNLIKDAVKDFCKACEKEKSSISCPRTDERIKEKKTSETSVKAFKFTCKCDRDYQVEFFKSTFEHIDEDLWQPLGDFTKKDRFVLSTDLWRKSGYGSGIAKILESVLPLNNYDYCTMIRGFFCILAGLVVVIFGALFKFSYCRGDIEAIFLYILLQLFRLFMLYQIFRGIMYILPFVQKWYRIFEWSCTKRFVFKTKVVPVGGSYMPDGSRGVSKTNEVVLFDESLEFYYGTGMKKVAYGDCVSVFETENLFVIMVQNNYIVSLQKKDMTQEQQAWVKERLSPHYKKECEYSVFQ